MVVQFVFAISVFSFCSFLTFASKQATDVVQDAQETFDRLSSFSDLAQEQYDASLKKIKEALVVLQIQKQNASVNLQGDSECADDEEDGESLQASYDLFLYELYDLSKEGKYGSKIASARSFEQLKGEINSNQ